MCPGQVFQTHPVKVTVTKGALEYTRVSAGFAHTQQEKPSVEPCQLLSVEGDPEGQKLVVSAPKELTLHRWATCATCETSHLAVDHNATCPRPVCCRQEGIGSRRPDASGKLRPSNRLTERYVSCSPSAAFWTAAAPTKVSTPVCVRSSNNSPLALITCSTYDRESPAVVASAALFAFASFCLLQAQNLPSTG